MCGEFRAALGRPDCSFPQLLVARVSWCVATGEAGVRCIHRASRQWCTLRRSGASAKDNHWLVEVDEGAIDEIRKSNWADGGDHRFLHGGRSTRLYRN